MFRRKKKETLEDDLLRQLDGHLPVSSDIIDGTPLASLPHMFLLMLARQLCSMPG